jgi:hypothetical protein
MQAIGDFTDWLEREVLRLGVEVRTGSYMEADDVLAERPDLLLVATGAISRGDGIQAARPGLPPEGCGLPHVTDAADLLLHGGVDHAGRSALILDDIGHYEAVAAAEFLVDRGASVTYVTGSSSFAPKMNGSFRNEVALQYLYRGRFRLLVGHQLTRISPEHCEVRPLQGERSEIIQADLVVLVTNKRPARGLYDALHGRIAAVEAIGDAASPRTLQDAVRDGHLAARRI